MSAQPILAEALENAANSFRTLAVKLAKAGLSEDAGVADRAEERARDALDRARGEEE